MSEHLSSGMTDVAEARWALSGTHRALDGAQQSLGQMQTSMSAASSWLSQIQACQQGRPHGMQGRQRGDGVRSFAGACEAAAQAGLMVDRRIFRSVSNVKAAVVIVDGLRPTNTRDEIDQVRLRRHLSALQDDLDTTRPLLQQTTERLGREAERARRAAPGHGGDRADVPVARVEGATLTADTDGRYVGQELERAQSAPARATTQADAICEVVKVRMQAHRHRSLGALPAAPGVSR